MNGDLFSSAGAAQPPRSPSAQETAWTVGAFTAAARALIQEGFGKLWIRGEVSGLKEARGGHWFFTLRDPDAQVKCAMWKTFNQRVTHPPEDGTQVYVLAEPTVWEERGEFRLTVLVLLPTSGIGAAQLQLEQTRAALTKDGLLDPTRKRPLPEFPATIAVVTSLDGAVLRDIVTVSRRRWPSIRLLVVGARVQGDGAAGELVRALARVNRLPGVDLCIVARGGGAKEDLEIFNHELVCRAVANLSVPTISAVGHETDITLTDLVADHRAATPSAAAELAVPDRADVLRQVATLGRRLGQGLTRRTRLGAERLERTADRLRLGIERHLQRPTQRLERIAAQLDALSPLRVFERGYSVARTVEGRIIRRRADLSAGHRFTLRVSDGELPARAE